MKITHNKTNFKIEPQNNIEEYFHSRIKKF